MEVVQSKRLQSLPPYLFIEIDRKKREAIAEGRDIINLGVGDPDQQSLTSCRCGRRTTICRTWERYRRK